MVFLKGDKQKQGNTVFPCTALLGRSFHSKPIYVSPKPYAELEEMIFFCRDILDHCPWLAGLLLRSYKTRENTVSGESSGLSHVQNALSNNKCKNLWRYSQQPVHKGNFILNWQKFLITSACFNYSNYTMKILIFHCNPQTFLFIYQNCSQ